MPAEVVDAKVTEIPLTTAAVAGRRIAATPTARAKVGALRAGTELTTSPVRVEGYGGVGLTWDPRVSLDDHDARFSLRTRSGDTWSDWREIPFHDEHGPDPASPEAQGARPGTDLVLVGTVDEVQVRGVMDGRTALPADLRMAITAPGEATDEARELPALTVDSGGDVPEEEPAPEPDPDADGLDLQAAVVTPKPVIYSRQQWGANENLRDRGSLRYGEVHAGFVHHTVNGNDYSRAEVPGILRSIYAYHTQSRGWSDVGYNFLVDKFGRIWEGRAGGIDRPVVGAHTLGYNDDAFAMSAIGNFETVQPRTAMLEAYGSLMAWKLSLHGVAASSTKQRVASASFPAINGHRDAGSTACPGRYLYAKLSTIRSLAAQAQRGWTGRELESDLASTPHPDLIVRRASDKQAFIIPTGGLTAFGRGQKSPDAWTGADSVVLSPDLTGDGIGDLLVRGTDGVTSVRPGTGTGFAAPVKPSQLFAGRDLVTPVGDLNGDGRNDVVARVSATGSPNVFFGDGAGGFHRVGSSGDWSGYDLLAATGDLDGDGRADLLARSGGILWRLPGTGTRTFGAPVKVSGGWGAYDEITGHGDFTRDGLGDLVVRAEGGAGFIRPSRADGTFGHPLGPIRKLRRGSSISAAHATGDGTPDLVVRRRADLVMFANKGTFDLGRPIPTGVTLRRANAVFNAGDWDRDGFGDIVLRTKRGVLQLRRGDGNGGFAAPVRLARGFRSVGLLAAVGDMTGDGWPDLMGQPGTGAMRIYPGKGLAGLRPSYVAYGRIAAARQIPVGRWDTDGAPDSLFRSGDRLSVYPGNGPGGLTGSRTLGIDLAPYDWVIGVSNVTLGDRSDVIVRERTTGRLYLLRATTSGFKPRRFLGEGLGGFDLAG